MVSIFGRTRAEAEPKKELVELDWEHPQGASDMTLKIVGVEKFADVDKVLDALRDNRNIVVMKIKSTLASDKDEVRKAIRRVQKTTYAIGGDIVGLAEDLIVVTPPNVSIDRSKPKPPEEV